MDAPTPHSHRLPHVAALDGLRGVAVLAVLAFHSQWAWASGGFLGVSLFFTLSGFLITSLLLVERSTTGRIRLSGFWSRRARRLLPGALLCLGAVGVAASLGAFAPGTDIRGDLLASLAYVANWHSIAGHSSYAALFAVPSPLEHFWSLAIEEQFYLVFPFLAFAVLGTGRRLAGAVRRLGLVAAAIWIIGTALALRAPWSTDVIYYSTLTRMPELAAGILLAVVLFDRRTQTWRVTSSPILGAMAASAGVLVFAAFATVTITDRNVDRGGLALFSLLSCALIVGALQHDRLGRLLSWQPLAYIGTISYGVYLAHWPIFVALPEGRLGLHGVALHAVQWALTFLVATASYRLLERPVRRGQLVQGARRIVVPALAATTVVALASVPPIHQQKNVVTVANAEDAFAAAAQTDNGGAPAVRIAQQNPTTVPVTDPATPPPKIPFPPLPTARPLNVAFFGDSTAAFLGLGFGRWASRHQSSARMVGGVSKLGCGLDYDGYDTGPDAPGDVAANCGDWHQKWPAYLDNHRVDVAIVSVGFNEAGPRLLPGDTQWRHLGDPVVDDRLRGEIRDAQAMFDSYGIPTVWLTSPSVDFVNELLPNLKFEQNQPGRMAQWNALLTSTSVPIASMRVLPFGEWVDTVPDFAPGASGRPDGLHFTPDGAATATDDWLWPQLVAQFAPG